MKLIDIKNLTFEYFRRDDEGNVTELVRALDGISLDVTQGEFIAILGRNGSGKSTLAKHLNALLLPGEGQVFVDGMDIEDEEVRLQIRQTAGMVFQNPDNQIVANLVEEDVAFGPENMGVSTSDIWNRVNRALSDTGMEQYRKQSPNHLSGGQKQRVAIAGVLAMEPKCIIFDEATAMLDPAGRRQILAVAKELQEKKGITIILITHHMEEALAADRVFVMQDGIVQAQGKPFEIFTREDLLEKCGLCLPAFYEYMNFLRGQDLLTEQECRKIHSPRQLERLLVDRYGNIQAAHNEAKAVDGTDAFPEHHPTVQTLDETQQGIKGILLNHVGYTYNKGYAGECHALKNVNLFIGRGEFLAIIGHTGSGKSTLMQHLNGLYLPMEGSVYFDGQDIAEKDFSMKKLRQKVGMVFQYPEYQLFAETVEKDVCFGPENMDIPKVEAQRRAYKAIEAVGLPDTIYDDSPLQLSGGQKRRVAIAGILAMEPEYLILDEPTAGLDPESAKGLLTMLKNLQINRGMAIVIVSHDMEQVAEYADRVVVMNQGEIKKDGSPGKIFENREELNSMGLEVPFGVRILQDLKNVGVDVNTHVCRRLDICGELLKLKDIEDSV
ncbi:MAG: energy-coupling factor transporter ATPase [Clostridium sp.]|nr:energy-coupling factor transporter ATPase [Clostridium sp.]